MTDSAESQTFDRRKFVVGATVTVAGAALLGPAVAHADASNPPWTGAVVDAAPTANFVVVTEAPLQHRTLRVDISPTTTLHAELVPGQTVMIQGAAVSSGDEIAADRIIDAGFGTRSDLPADRR